MKRHRSSIAVLAIFASVMFASCQSRSETDEKLAKPPTEPIQSSNVETVDSDIAAIADLQSKHGPEFVTTLDCTKYSEAWKKYCEEEKKKFPEVDNPSDLGFWVKRENPPASLSGKTDDAFQKAFWNTK